MRLLIVAQVVDVDDPVLSFFHRWIIEFAKHYERVVVICLREGRHNLPPNVRVLSLGKESGQSRFKYIIRFFKYTWRERKNYDSVFVHMNQEYVLLAGWWWRLVGKKLFMWRNHHMGNWLTGVAVWFCTKVFCTSKFSYTARYQKTILMPVGIDTEIFLPDFSVAREPRSILFLARMAPVKNPDLLVEVLGGLKRQGVNFRASFYGDPDKEDQKYYQSMIKTVADLGLSEAVTFYAGVPNNKTPAIYARHEIFINLSSSGMYDKTIFEAMACGCLVLVSNQNLVGLLDNRFVVSELKTSLEIMEKVSGLLGLPETEKNDLIAMNHQLVKEHSLKNLAHELQSHMI